MKIPETSNPFKVIVNGVEKNYEAGATVSDDASVKEIIDNGDSFPPAALPVETPFPIPESGTNVVANPTLAGDEDSLTGIQIGDTKYAVGGGGGGALFVTISKSGSTWTADKTGAEILAAINAGQQVYATHTDDFTNDSIIAPLSRVVVGPHAQAIWFVDTSVDVSGASSYGHKILSREGLPDAVIEVEEYYPDEGT